jgi:hypothetical protein
VQSVDTTKKRVDGYTDSVLDVGHCNLPREHCPPGAHPGPIARLRSRPRSRARTFCGLLAQTHVSIYGDKVDTVRRSPGPAPVLPSTAPGRLRSPERIGRIWPCE